MVDEEFRFASAIDGMPLHAYRWAPAGPARRRRDRARRGRARAALRALCARAERRRVRGAGARSSRARPIARTGRARRLRRRRLERAGCDLAQFIADARARCPQRPLALFGHSMGSFAAQQYCVTHASRSTRSCCPDRPRSSRRSEQVRRRVATERGVRAGAHGVRLVEPRRGRGRQVHRRSVVRIRGRRRTPQEHAAARPLAVQRPEHARAIAPELPVLLVAATPIRSIASSRACTGSSSAGAKRAWQCIDTRYYAGGRHEMLNETNRDEVTRDICDWLCATLAS